MTSSDTTNKKEISKKLSSFETLAKINVNDHVEKKGKFTYLSWAWAVDVLRRAEPEAVWEVVRFNGLPFLKTEVGYFVEVSVTVKGITLSQIHPVIDSYNKPIKTPDSFQINTSIQRALVKAIALHGIGLYIYAGEDLPEDGESDVKKAKEPKKNAFGLSPDGDIANGDDMKETLNKKNEEDFNGLKSLIENCGGEEELKEVWIAKQNVKIINSLRKWRPELYELLITVKDAMKESFLKK